MYLFLSGLRSVITCPKPHNYTSVGQEVPKPLRHFWKPHPKTTNAQEYELDVINIIDIQIEKNKVLSS